MLIEGEPGSGKTTVLSAGLDGAADLGCLLLRGSPGADDKALSLRPPGATTSAEAGGGDGAAPDLEFPAPGSGAADVQRTLAAVERMCDRSPVVLAVDDLHRAEPDHLLLWHRLSRLAARLPLLLVATARPTAPRSGSAFDLARRALTRDGAALLELEPLTSAEVAVLATAALGASPSANLRRRLEAAGGNPAYVLDLIESMRQGNGIRIEGSIAVATDTGAAATFSPRLVEQVHARLASLSSDALAVLRFASLLGVEFTGRELAVLSEREPHQLLSVLDEVMPAGVLVEHGVRLRFRHPLVSQALYHSMRETKRSALHRAAAKALDAAGASVERVAEQLLSAAALAQDWPAEWIAANADGLTFRAPELAIGLFRRAIDHAAPDDPGRLLLEEKLAAAMYLTGRSDCVPAALGLLEYDADPVRRAAWAFMSGTALNRVGRYTQGLEAVDEGVAALAGAMDSLPDGEADLWTARFTGLRAQLVYAQGLVDEAGALAEWALLEGGRLSDPLTEWYGAHVSSMILAAAGDLTSALARIEQGLAALGERWRLADQRVLMMQNQAVMLGRLDRTAEAYAVVERAQEIAERHGVSWRLAGVVARSVALLYLAGRWDEALAALRPVIDRPDSAKQRNPLSAVRLLILVHRGQMAEARGHVESVRGERESPDGRLLQYPIRAVALFAEADGRIPDALAALKPALLEGGVWDLDDRSWCLPDLTRLALAAGDEATARLTVAVAEADARRETANTRRRASARRCRGLLDRDLSVLAQAAEYYQQADVPLFLAHTREDQAVVAAARGDAETARRHLEDAAEGYLRLGALWDLSRADARLRELGVRRGRRSGRARPGTGWEALTPAEAKIASLVAEGSSNPEIADLLFLSPRTVQTHVSHILAKLGLRSRSEIAREAARRVP
ncbi:helix-turn-helix transcriptional regulator [Actinocrinis sp.]|uniref:helix-turn-helix transcriptional regulator n=1 Tax=Actinocrinis sp. TaxID=1920516 RepID=UPI0039C86CB1